MGIYDRDYYKNRPKPGQLQHWRAKDWVHMWSVTTWLIVLCVVVFVIDGFLPVRVVWTGKVYGADLTSVSPSVYRVEAEKSKAQEMPITRSLPDGTTQTSVILAVPVVEKATNKVIAWAEVTPMRFLSSFLHFSTRLGFFQFEFWRLFGFQFLHADQYHLIFNMIGLYLFGPIVEEYLGSKRYLAFYLLCGVFGALMYLLLNLLGFIAATIFGEAVRIPGLLFDDPATPLVGASAGIFGIIMAGAYLTPNAVINLFFVIPIRTWVLAYGLVIISMYKIFFGLPNANGEAGHLGGAIAGYYFIRHTHHLHNFFDILGRADPSSKHFGGRARQRSRSAPSAADVDRVLQKISEQGLASLTDAERETLRQYPRRNTP